MSKTVAEVTKISVMNMVGEDGSRVAPEDEMFAGAEAHVSRNSNPGRVKIVPIIEGIKTGMYATSPKFGDCKIARVEDLVNVGTEKMQFVVIAPRKKGQTLAGGLTETKVLAGTLVINALNKNKKEDSAMSKKGAKVNPEIKPENKNNEEENAMNNNQEGNKGNNVENNKEENNMNNATIEESKKAIETLQAANFSLDALLANIKVQPGTPAASAPAAAPVVGVPATAALPGAAAPSAPAAAPRVAIAFPSISLSIPSLNRNNFWYTEDTPELADVTNENSNLKLGIVNIKFSAGKAQNQVAKADVTFFPNIVVKNASIWLSKDEDGSMYVQFPSSKWTKDGKTQYFNSVTLGDNARPINAQILRYLLTFSKDGKIEIPVLPWYAQQASIADVLQEEVTNAPSNAALAISDIKVIAPSQGMKDAGILAKVTIHTTYGVTFSGMNVRVAKNDGRTLVVLPPSDSFERRDGNGKVNLNHFELGTSVQMQVLRYLDSLIK